MLVRIAELTGESPFDPYIDFSTMNLYNTPFCPLFGYNYCGVLLKKNLTEEKKHASLNWHRDFSRNSLLALFQSIDLLFLGTNCTQVHTCSKPSCQTTTFWFSSLFLFHHGNIVSSILIIRLQQCQLPCLQPMRWALPITCFLAWITSMLL